LLQFLRWQYGKQFDFQAFQLDPETVDHDLLRRVLNCVVNPLVLSSDEASSSVNCLPFIISPLSAEGLSLMLVHNPAS
jgi:hypothetical protein